MVFRSDPQVDKAVSSLSVLSSSLLSKWRGGEAYAQLWFLPARRYKGKCFVMSPSKQHVLPLYLPPFLSLEPRLVFWTEHVMSSFVILPLKCSRAWGEKQKLPKLPDFTVGGSLLFLYSLCYSLPPGSTYGVFWEPSFFPPPPVSQWSNTEDQTDYHF